MNVLVTGGTGFTGSHLVKRLLERGCQVRVLDSQKGLFHDELKSRGADVHLGSITDCDLVTNFTKDCEVVYHLAAAFRELNVAKQHYWNVNVEGTRNVAEAAKQCRVRRLVYCSTQGVHGHIKHPPGNEESPIAPEDYYQYTKYEGERVVAQFVADGMDAVTIRPTAIYGPGDPARFLMLFRMARKGRFKMFGKGTTYYHPVYIDNLVDGFELAASSTRDFRGEAYLIADAQAWTLNELVQRVGAALGIAVRIRHFPFWPLYAGAAACEAVCKPLRLSPPLFRRRVNWFRQDRAFSINKARRELNYEAHVGIDEGLERTARWYQSNGYL